VGNEEALMTITAFDRGYTMVRSEVAGSYSRSPERPIDHPNRPAGIEAVLHGRGRGGFGEVELTESGAEPEVRRS
jgi:hypothetical protein